MQFDQSTTVVARGRITMAAAAGESIPQGWALDADGQPTTDPNAALQGSMLSVGGYKGWGFGLMAELLSAGMTGSVTSQQVRPLKAPNGPPHDLGQFCMLIDPGVSGAFPDRLDEVAGAVGHDAGARMPGQGKSLADPVELADDLWAQVCKLA